MLYAQDRYAVLLIFQAMDAAGKDGTIRAVMSGINPAGRQVFSFKQPSREKLDHDFYGETPNVCRNAAGSVFLIAVITKRSWWSRCTRNISRPKNFPLTST